MTILSTLLAPNGPLRRTLRRLPEAAVGSGLPPAWLGYRWVARESVSERVRRRGETVRYETVHPETVAANPLPRNVASRDELPAERGWWGYSFHDVPERRSGETFVATVPRARVVTYRDGGGEFRVAVLGADGRALSLREMDFRPGHARVLRRSRAPARVERATWILERVYDNYSHWLTAHLGKLCLLRERGELDGVVLPPEPRGFVAASLGMLGIEPERFPTFDPSRPLEVGELTLVGVDRFRPELLRAVRDVLGVFPPARRHRRIFVSRAECRRRRLVDEEEVWPLLRAAGFERVATERLPFEDQVRLMGETSVLVAPHGAGLTNMMFCPPGTHVVEIADPSFPNPNFYAVASAMEHPYWLVPAKTAGGGHPLERDMRVGRERIAEVLERLEPAVEVTCHE